MSIKDYLKLDFKKPEIDSNTSFILKRKEVLENKLENLYSRLETVEICNANSKFFDSEILANSLFKDIIDFAASFENKIAEQFPSDFTNFTAESEINTLFSDTNSLLLLKSIEEDHISKLEASLSKLIYKLEKYIFKKNKIVFQNSYDNYKNKIKVQLILFPLAILFLGYQGFLFYKKVQTIRPDIANLYYMSEKTEVPSPANKLEANVTPGETWQEAKFILQKPSIVTNVKFEPLKQNYARIQFKEVQYRNEKGEIKYTKTLKLNSIGMVDNKVDDEICCVEGFKPGKLAPDKYIEFETVGADSSFYIKLGKMTDIKEIILVYRYIKNSKKFTD